MSIATDSVSHHRMLPVAEMKYVLTITPLIIQDTPNTQFSFGKRRQQCWGSRLRPETHRRHGWRFRREIERRAESEEESESIDDDERSEVVVDVDRCDISVLLRTNREGGSGGDTERKGDGTISVSPTNSTRLLRGCGATLGISRHRTCQLSKLIKREFQWRGNLLLFFSRTQHIVEWKMGGNKFNVI